MSQHCRPYVPNVISGFDPRPAKEKGACSFNQPTLAEWIATLEQVRKRVEAPGARLGFPSTLTPGAVVPAITLYAWNEFAEGGMICPTKGEGWNKLEGIQAVFGKANKAAIRTNA
jgi:hypothetical protein